MKDGQGAKSLPNLDTFKQKARKAIQHTSNEYPLHVFPQTLQTIIKKVCDTLNFRTEFLAPAVFSAVSTAIGATHAVQIKKGWCEHANFYNIIIADKGSNKSAPLSWALKPIHAKDKEYIKQYNKDLAEYNRINAMTEKERKEANIKENPKPIPIRLVIQNPTAEKLEFLLSVNPRGLLLERDELAGWLADFYRYNKSGVESFYMSCWNGYGYEFSKETVNDTGSLSFSSPFLGVIGTTQPSVFPEFGDGKRAQNGFVDRLCCNFPPFETRKPLNLNELTQDVIDEYFTIINRLLGLTFADGGVANIIPLSKEAFNRFVTFQEYNIRLPLQPDYLHFDFAKFEPMLARVALVLHMLQMVCDGVCDDEISVDTMELAIDLIEYHRKSFIKAVNSINNATVVDKLSRDKQQLYNELPQEFKRKQAVDTGTKFNIPSRTIDAMLKDRNLFDQMAYGEYRKVM